jgi:hypothetical protein
MLKVGVQIQFFDFKLFPLRGSRKTTSKKLEHEIVLKAPMLQFEDFIEGKERTHDSRLFWPEKDIPARFYLNTPFQFMTNVLNPKSGFNQSRSKTFNYLTIINCFYDITLSNHPIPIKVDEKFNDIPEDNNLINKPPNEQMVNIVIIHNQCLLIIQCQKPITLEGVIIVSDF